MDGWMDGWMDGCTGWMHRISIGSCRILTQDHDKILLKFLFNPINIL